MEAEVNRVLRGGNPHEVLSEGFGLSLTRKDLQTLSNLNWLNDEVRKCCIRNEGGKNRDLIDTIKKHSSNVATWMKNSVGPALMNIPPTSHGLPGGEPQKM